MHTTMQRTLITRTQGTGNDLVILHGWGLNSGAFHEFIPYLTDSFRVTTIDLPGFGDNNGMLPQPYTLDALASMLIPAIPSDCIVVGWSLGGLIAQQIALRSDVKLSGLITIASTPRFSATRGWPGIAPDVLAAFEAQLETDYRRTLDRFLAIQAMGSATARQDIKTIRQHITGFPDPSTVALRDGLGLLSDADLRDQIGRIHCPTLRVYGRLDSLVPLPAIDKIHELQPNADSVVMAHAAHAPFISHPQQSADLIRQFALHHF